ncbi:MAG: sensor domain-containing diguanylate cyclase [Acidobacteriota bacterium]
MITFLGGVVGAELWQRRKLKQIVRQIAHHGRLTQAAIRITNEIRGSVDVSQILGRTTLEVAQTLNIEHCYVLLFGKRNKEEESACSCESRNHEREIEIAFADAIKYLLHESRDRFITHNDPNSADAKAERTRYPVCGLPITRDLDGSGGFLLVLSNDPTRLWSESEIQMLLAVAHQLSLSVNQARVFAAKEQETLTDFLTGCLNRRGFNGQLQDHFRAATVSHRSISLIMCDLDHFKAINDNYGHDVGDEVIRSLAGVLLEEAANGAIAARVGGEEFALLVVDHSLEEAAAIAERLRQRVEVMAVPRLDRQITISSGVASAPVHANSTASLYALADEMLYRAKASGRNRVCVCEAGTTTRS